MFKSAGTDVVPLLDKKKKINSKREKKRQKGKIIEGGEEGVAGEGILIRFSLCFIDRTYTCFFMNGKKLLDSIFFC